MPAAECGFCGQDHVVEGMVEGFWVMTCPNMPAGWVAITRDGGETMIEVPDGSVR